MVTEKKRTRKLFNRLCAAKYTSVQRFFIGDDELGFSGQQKKDYICACSKEEQRLDRDSGDSSRELNRPVTYRNDLQSG